MGLAMVLACCAESRTAGSVPRPRPTASSAARTIRAMIGPAAVPAGTVKLQHRKLRLRQTPIAILVEPVEEIAARRADRRIAIFGGRRRCVFRG